MSSLLVRGFARRFLQDQTSGCLARFGRDRRGVAAIEFAFIAPILIIFYFGMAETCMLLMAKRRVNHAASAVADLVSQTNGATNKATLDLQLMAGNVILSPFPTTGFNIRLISVTKETVTEPQVKVDWSYPAGGPAPGSVYAPGTPLSPGESVVVAVATYDYQSSIGYFIPGVRQMTQKAELRPRKEDTVACTDCTT